MKRFIDSVKKLVSPGCGPRSGITLIEVIVSIALLGIVVILVSDMLMTAFTITYTNQPKTSNVYKVGGQVGTASIPAGASATSAGVTVSGTAGTVTVTLNTPTSSYSSSITGTFQDGNTTAGTSSTYAASGWAFNPAPAS